MAVAKRNREQPSGMPMQEAELNRRRSYSERRQVGWREARRTEKLAEAPVF
jgi:hypothetical protein